MFMAMVRLEIMCIFLAPVCLYVVATEQEYCTKEKCPESWRKPNFIIFIADDLGYGDLFSYGHPVQEFGGIDKMSAEGLRFTSFYSADSMCTPSRAALLTGRLPIRSGVVGGPKRVFVPKDTGGLPKDELTLAEALKSLRYATGMVGKWHLGINAENRTDGAHLPSKHGFDFVGYNLPFTNVWECDESGVFMKNGPASSECFLYRGDEIVQQPINHETLTVKLLADFEMFIEERPKDRPFFFYFSFPHVHTDVFASAPFKGSSKRGLFGDNLNEMHWAVDRVFDILKRENLDENMATFFLSDHGPHRELCQLGGVAGPFKGGKKSTFEGGFRIPAIVRWPGVVEPGRTCGLTLSALDLFPTIFRLAGGGDDNRLPDDVIYDGLDVSDALLTSCRSPSYDKIEKRVLYFYCNQSLLAVRYGALKFHFATHNWMTDDQLAAECPNGMPLKDMYSIKTCNDYDLNVYDPPLVYDLNKDPSEMHPLDFANFVEQWEIVRNDVELHKRTLATKRDCEIGRFFSDDVIPCCNYPECRCNYP